MPVLAPAFVGRRRLLDPGNFATNIAGGAKFVYLLPGLLAANLISMAGPDPSRKLVIATGENLASSAAVSLPRPASVSGCGGAGRDGLAPIPSGEGAAAAQPASSASRSSRD